MILIGLASRLNTDCMIGGDGKAVSDLGFSESFCEHGRISRGSENPGNADRVKRRKKSLGEYLATACIHHWA